MFNDFPLYTTDYISGVMSLRKPQTKSLKILEEITNAVPLRKGMNLKAALGAVHAMYPICTDFERDFMSLTFALATGVGKTRLMGAFIAYLYTQHNIRNFFVVAPNTTIYEKLKKDLSDNGSPKYVFRGLGCFTVQPQIITDDDYREKNLSLFESDVHIFVYNIDKFNKEGANMKKVNELIGDSFYQALSDLPDLVLIMDESHHYRAERGMQALNELHPLLGLELTATPLVTKGNKQVPFKNVVYEYPLSKAIEDGYTRTPFAVTRSDIDFYNFGDEQLDKMMLLDGITCHESTKRKLEVYAVNHGKPVVKPFMLVVTIIDKSTKRIGTVGINPSDFPFNFYLFICCPDDRYQCVHHLPLVLKADILPVIQIPGNAFHLLHRHSVRREFCNLIGNGLPPCVQFLNFAVGIGEQNRACARQRVKQLFNLAFYLCQFQPLCSQFRGDFCSLVPTCQRLKIFQLFNHRPIDYRFQFVQLHAPAARTRLAVRMDGAAQVKNTVGVRRHERIAAFPAFDFSRHPCVPGFPCGLVGVAGKQLLPAFQPQLRWDKPLMWSQYQRLSLQVLVLVLCIPLALIVIAAICPGKVGGIIVNIRPLAFVKLVYVEVSHDINRVSENNAQSSP